MIAWAGGYGSKGDTSGASGERVKRVEHSIELWGMAGVVAG